MSRNKFLPYIYCCKPSYDQDLKSTLCKVESNVCKVLKNAQIFVKEYKFSPPKVLHFYSYFEPWYIFKMKKIRILNTIIHNTNECPMPLSIIKWIIFCWEKNFGCDKTMQTKTLRNRQLLFQLKVLRVCLEIYISKNLWDWFFYKLSKKCSIFVEIAFP